ncbi:MAG: preprotein translocase subunit YajC [Bacteroidales bacterium]|nr:preprotein translocase subunit YajC [Bacteroidales bacterium]
MNQLFTLLQAAPAAAPKGGGSMTLIFILLIILIFYFFMIRPQQKRQKQVEEFRKNLQKGDKVTTVGGIHGKIREVKETTFVIEIAHDVCIEIEKAAINVDESQTKAQASKDNSENQ